MMYGCVEQNKGYTSNGDEETPERGVMHHQSPYQSTKYEEQQRLSKRE